MRLVALAAGLKSYKNNDKQKHKDMGIYSVDERGYYGIYGGAYVPEILHGCVEELRRNYLDIIESEDFQKEYMNLLRDYAGRP